MILMRMANTRALTHAALERALLELDDDEPDVDPEDGQGDGAETKPPEQPGGAVSITGGNAWIRTGPGKRILKQASPGTGRALNREPG